MYYYSGVFARCCVAQFEFSDAKCKLPKYFIKGHTFFRNCDR
mgnify:CR=1 FL=1